MDEEVLGSDPAGILLCWLLVQIAALASPNFGPGHLTKQDPLQSAPLRLPPSLSSLSAPCSPLPAPPPPPIINKARPPSKGASIHNSQPEPGIDSYLESEGIQDK